MSSFSKVMVALLFTVLGAQAMADTVVQCSDAKVTNGPVILQYIVSGAKSARLASPITYNQVTYAQSDVAQYMTTSESMYFLVDSGGTSPVISFLAALPCKPTPTFIGAVSTYGANGKITSTKSLKCKLTAL